MKALIVATVYGFVESFLKSDIKLLQDKGYKVYVAVNTEIMNHGGLDGLDIELVDIPFARSPFSSENKRAFDLLYNLMENEAFDLVHCHTPVGGVEARKAVDKLAANGKKRPKVIYTAHGFHFYKGAPVGNWLTFYNVEKKYAKSTDVIVTINHEDYILASEKFKPRLNVRYCPGVGIDTEEIAKLSGNADRAAIRKGLGVPDSAYLIMSIGELNDNKNHEAVIKALHLYNDKNIYYVIYGEGPKRKALETMIKSFGMEENVKLAGFSEDAVKNLAAADLFILPSKREGLCVSLLEAMAMGLPCLTSEIRGNVDLMQPVKLTREDNFVPLFKPNDPAEISEKIKFLRENKAVSEKLADLNKGRAKDFDQKKVTARMSEIYDSVEKMA